MRLLKNVQDERDCPKQIILGCMNKTYCPVLGLDLFVEKLVQEGEGVTSQWLFGNSVSDLRSTLREQYRESSTTKNNYGNTIKRVITSEASTQSKIEGNIGTHSIKKFATKKYEKGGASKDEKYYLARCKVRRIQDRYIDTHF